jgi:hypothetical protein
MRETNDEAVHTPRPENEGEWITPPVAATLAAAGLLLLMTYVKNGRPLSDRITERKCRCSH